MRLLLTALSFFFKTQSECKTILDPDQDRHPVGPDLDPNCLQRLSAHDQNVAAIKIRDDQIDTCVLPMYALVEINNTFENQTVIIIISILSRLNVRFEKSLGEVGLMSTHDICFQTVINSNAFLSGSLVVNNYL